MVAIAGQGCRADGHHFDRNLYYTPLYTKGEALKNRKQRFKHALNRWRENIYYITYILREMAARIVTLTRLLSARSDRICSSRKSKMHVMHFDDAKKVK